MKKLISTGLLTTGLVVGLATSAFAAQTGLYVGSNYYSTSYLGTLSLSQRAAVLNNTKASPDTSFAVIGSKYVKFASFNGIASLKEGADSIIPAQVTNVMTGKLINTATGTEVNGEEFNVISIE